jgi:hypothetical protein
LPRIGILRIGGSFGSRATASPDDSATLGTIRRQARFAFGLSTDRALWFLPKAAQPKDF